MSDFSVNIYSVRAMLKLIQTLFKPNRFLRNIFFPQNSYSDTQECEVDIETDSQDVADFCEATDAAFEVTPDGYTTITLSPGYIKEKIQTTAQRLLKRLAGETPYNRKNIAQRAAAKHAKDIRKLDKRRQNKIEKMCSEALFGGEIVTKKDGSKKISVPMPAAHKVILTLDDRWSEATCDILEDLEMWINSIRDESGEEPEYLLLGKTVKSHFFGNTAVNDLYELNKKEYGELKPKKVKGGVYHGTIVIDGCELKIYTCNEYNKILGSKVPVVPEDKVLLSVANLGVVHFGAIENLDSNDFMGESYPSTFTKDDPKRKYVVLESAPLPFPRIINGFIFATVL